MVDHYSRRSPASRRFREDGSLSRVWSPDVIIGKDNEQGTIFCREAGRRSCGWRLSMAAVHKAGLDLRVAEDCAYDGHTWLCLASLSRSERDRSPSLYWKLMGLKPPSDFKMETCYSCLTSDNAAIVIVVVSAHFQRSWADCGTDRKMPMHQHTTGCRLQHCSAQDAPERILFRRCDMAAVQSCSLARNDGLENSRGHLALWNGR